MKNHLSHLQDTLKKDWPFLLSVVIVAFSIAGFVALQFNFDSHLRLSITDASEPASQLALFQESELVRKSRTDFLTFLQQQQEKFGGKQKSLLDDLASIEFPLTDLQISRADQIKQVVDPLSQRRSRMTGPCNVEGLPLDVWFANYTIDRNGREIPGSEGWTLPERTRFSNFLCRMLPVIRDLHADPFERWDITLVKDLYYSGGWIFIPSTLEIHSDGSWNPRLLTHEFIHAFQGQRLMSSDQDWRYVPTLSGFQEGFGEGVAYLAMNEYVRRFCNRGDCSQVDVPSDVYWDSYLEWLYDFSNDESMTTENFWSDSGGTLKYYERYLIAAAAIMRLETAIPGFGYLFNEEYYARIRKDPTFRPTRETVVQIIEFLNPTIDGIAARDWIDQQHIFDSRYIPGKKDWTVNYTPFSDINGPSDHALYFVETFPGGSEWAQYIPGCPLVPGATSPYLFHRLNGTRGTIKLYGSWNDQLMNSFNVTMRVGSDYTVRGCNENIGSFGANMLQFVDTPSQCGGAWPEPVCILRPATFGLYHFFTDWINPQYQRPPGPPFYGMPYDQTQQQIENRYFTLAGRVPADFNPIRHKLVGGIVGADSGTLTISHSSQSGTVSTSVRNGAFYTEVPTCPTWPVRENCWVGPYAEWDPYLVTVPGTLTFTFVDEKGSEYVEQKTIVFGRNHGRHNFLLRGREGKVK